MVGEIGQNQPQWRVAAILRLNLCQMQPYIWPLRLDQQIVGSESVEVSGIQIALDLMARGEAGTWVVDPREHDSRIILEILDIGCRNLPGHCGALLLSQLARSSAGASVSLSFARRL